MLKLPHTAKSSVSTRQADYPSGELIDRSEGERGRALLALSHTPIEDRLYQAMLEETGTNGMNAGVFSIRRLMMLTGLNSYSTVRRARCGLQRKLSIETLKIRRDDNKHERSFYQIFKPEEIFSRRKEAGMKPYPKEAHIHPFNTTFDRALASVARGHELSRREAQVALSCIEGMTNAEIGARLGVSSQTVKFHLRNIFTKFGVRRRTELISRLLVQGSE